MTSREGWSDREEEAYGWKSVCGGRGGGGGVRE